MPGTRIKFCGLTGADDVRAAVAAGADAVGFIVAESPRRVTLERLSELAAAVPPLVARVGVVVEPSSEELAVLRSLGLVLQFHGDELATRCEFSSGGFPYIKVFHVALDAPPEATAIGAFEAYAHALLMFDTRVDGRSGGTGRQFAWDVLAPLARRRPIVVSGGLTPQNVADCIRRVRPYAVDVRSGIETSGEKDPQKMRAFVRAVREADAEPPTA